MYLPFRGSHFTGRLEAGFGFLTDEELLSVGLLNRNSSLVYCTDKAWNGRWGVFATKTTKKNVGNSREIRSFALAKVILETVTIKHLLCTSKSRKVEI